MSRVVRCPISGRSFTFSTTYFNKRVKEYGDEEKFIKYFVVKKVKTLIERGYNVQEIRNILCIDSVDLLDVNSQQVRDVIIYYELHSKSISKKQTTNFSTNKSDPEVVVFINNIRNYE